MTKEEYQEYLKSDHWLKAREERKRIDGYKCALCGSLNDINVHHLTYARVGNEDIDIDLITLCRSCHMMMHEAIEKAKPKINQCRKEFQDRFIEYVDKNASIKAIFAEYEEERGKIYAECLTSFCSRIPASKTGKLLSIINRACYTPLAELVDRSRLTAVIRKSGLKNAYAVGCNKFSQIIKQRRRF